MDFYYEKRFLYRLWTIASLVLSAVLSLPAIRISGVGMAAALALPVLLFGTAFAMLAVFFPKRLVRLDDRGLRIRRAMPLWWCDVVVARKTFLGGLQSCPIVVFEINPRAVYPLKLWKVYRLCGISPFSIPLYALEAQERKVLCGEIAKRCKTLGF